MTTKSKTPQAKRIMRRLGIVRPRDLERSGISRAVLARLVDGGEVQRLARGLYATPETIGSNEHWGLMEVAKRVPSGVVCLLSALSYHRIGTQLPSRVWVAIEHKAWAPRIEYPRIRVVRMTRKLLAEMVETHEVGGVPVRITTPARTVVDCFKFRNKIGLDVALEALQAGWADRRFSMEELTEAAKPCRMRRVMRPYLEMLA